MEGGNIMSFQKCPICNGTGASSLSGTYSEIPVCPTCGGQRIISEITGLPPQKVNTENVKKMPTFIKDAQLNVFVEDHMRNVIDELDKTGELPYHIRPVNALKRTELEKEKIRMERLMDSSLQKIDEERGIDIFESHNYIKLSEKDLKQLEYKPTTTQDGSNISSKES